MLVLAFGNVVNDLADQRGRPAGQGRAAPARQARVSTCSGGPGGRRPPCWPARSRITVATPPRPARLFVAGHVPGWRRSTPVVLKRRAAAGRRRVRRPSAGPPSSSAPRPPARQPADRGRRPPGDGGDPLRRGGQDGGGRRRRPGRRHPHRGPPGRSRPPAAAGGRVRRRLPGRVGRTVAVGPQPAPVHRGGGRGHARPRLRQRGQRPRRPGRRPPGQGRSAPPVGPGVDARRRAAWPPPSWPGPSGSPWSRPRPVACSWGASAAVAALYTPFLKRVPLVGNAVFAAQCGATVVFGAQAADGCPTGSQSPPPSW